MLPAYTEIELAAARIAALEEERQFVQNNVSRYEKTGGGGRETIE